MKLEEYNPDFNNLITISQVLDKRGTKQTSIILDTTNNRFYIIDDDNNAYPLNPNDPEWSQTIIELLNQIIQTTDNCPECIISQLESIRESLTTILNSDTNSLINSSKNEIISYLNIIDDKLIPITVEVEVPKEVIVYKDKLVPVHITEYVLTETTVYVEVPCSGRPTPLPTKKTIKSHLPIKPPIGRVITDPVYFEFKGNPKPTRRLSPRFINGKLTYVELH